MALSHSFVERNTPLPSGELKPCEKAEARASAFCERHFGGPAVKVGEDSIHEDWRSLDANDLDSKWAHVGDPDFSISRDGIRLALVEVKSGFMSDAAGWYISQSQIRDFPLWQRQLEDEALSRLGVLTPEELPCFIDEVAAPFYLALVHSASSNLVCLMRWERARRVARRDGIIETDSFTRKYLIPAVDVASEQWWNMETGERAVTPVEVHAAAQRSVAPRVYVDASNPEVAACLACLEFEAFEQVDPATTCSQDEPTTEQVEQLNRLAKERGLAAMLPPRTQQEWSRLQAELKARSDEPEEEALRFASWVSETWKNAQHDDAFEHFAFD